ncbi:MAG TPA: 16S rRNA (adenine(1518)-N(6)/adenine(1519)-N(6))-dimethyltransferase RsmA [Blastocatellia bacterium]|nr:16S rRNA (adenine(1518)-N(6)/adenine(1519)-N(6))-dimethyltransferase RsmA [Blastocatellia bacterium]
MTRAKKSLGQHFLVDKRVIERIVQSVSPQPGDLIVEIGPGRGALTRPLANASRFLLAVETDRELAELLTADLAGPRVRIVHADAMKVDWRQLIDSAVEEFQRLDPEVTGQVRVRIAANLPYYISTPILQRLIFLKSLIYDMTLMLQDEVVDRIASSPGGRDYGYLSVLCQFYCEVEKLFEVPASAFKPAPEVRSAVVHLQVRKVPPAHVVDEARFISVVQASFAQRRKTILNNLKAARSMLRPSVELLKALEEAGIAPTRRAETLSIEEFACLSEHLFRG